MNFKPLLERVATAFGFDNPDQLFNQTPAQPPAAPHYQQPPQNGHGGQVLLGGGQMPMGVQQAVGQQ